MECNCNNNNNGGVIPWVRGNRLPLIICVFENVVTQEQVGDSTLTVNEMTRVPYTIQDNDTVTVIMKSGFRQVEMPFTTDGNKVMVTDNGELQTGTYTVEVTIVRGDGARGRWQETRQVRIYENTSEAQLGEMYSIDADLFFYAKGDTGTGIADITNNPDGTLTITMTDGTSYTTEALKGDKGDKGDTGERGVSIVSFDVTGQTDVSVIYTVTFSDDTTQDISVPKGPQGDTGLTGNGISTTTLNSDYTLTIAYTDGTTYTTPSIRGAQGAQGVSVIGFTQTGETATNTMYNLVFSDGRTQSVAIPKGVKGDKGDPGNPGPQGAQGPKGDTVTATDYTLYSVQGSDSQGAMSQDATTKAISAQTGYYTCGTAAGTPEKVVTVENGNLYKRTLGGHFKVKMTNANTAASGVTLQIGSETATTLWYNGAAASADNSWEENEVISVYYDGTYYQASNAQGGGGKDESDNVNLNARIGIAQGSTSTVDGAIVNTDTNRVYTYDKLFGKGTFHVKTNSGFIIRNIIIYNSDNTFNKTYFNGDGLEVTDMYITVEEGKYARVSFCKTNTSASILPTDNIISQCKFVPVGDKLDAVGDVVLKSVSIPFVEGYYIAGNTDYGTSVKDSSNAVTHLLKIADYDKIYYTGKTGIVWAMFYDSNKSPINHVGVTNLMVKDVEVLQYAPANAVYVKLSSRILSASNPPSVYPHAYGLQKAFTKEKTVDVLKNGVQAYYDMSCLALYDRGEYTPFTTTNTSIPIEFGSLEHLYYTGSMGAEVANWFDEDGEWIGSNVNANGNTIVNIDILPYAIEGAKYVTLSSRNSSHSTPPSVTPNITAYLYSRDMSVDSLFERFNVPTDGVTDATTALQNVIGASGEVVNFKPGTYVISSPLQINTAIVKVLNGNNAILKVSSDVAAINMYGTCTTNTASPATLTEAQKLEASTIIRELRITSSNLNQGEGIVISNTFQPVIEKCFIYNIKNGIVFRGRNRNGIIEGNNIWYCYNAGLLIDSGMNMHQCNIYGNHISYCQICVHVNNPMQLANFQFVGNDIEIGEVPEHDLTDTRCIVFNYSATQYALCSEFEFSGNTIQGHNHSDSLIEFHGNSTIKIENVSFAGNQISNCNADAIKLSHIHNFAFCGNTYRLVYGKVFNLSKTIDGLTISNEVCESGSTGFMGCESDTVLNAVTLNGCTGRGMTGGVILSATTINGLSICCNNIASSNVTVSANTIDYVNVFGNMCRGTYNIGTCTHSNIGNNI